MANLVGIDLAMQWVKRDPLDYADMDVLQFCLDTAEAQVLDYVKQRRYADAGDLTAWEATVDAWTEATAPPVVRAAILRLMADLDYDRGDMSASEHIQRRPGDLPDHVASLLHRLRDPALA